MPQLHRHAIFREDIEKFWGSDRTDAIPKRSFNVRRGGEWCDAVRRQSRPMEWLPVTCPGKSARDHFTEDRRSA